MFCRVVSLATLTLVSVGCGPVRGATLVGDAQPAPLPSAATPAPAPARHPFLRAIDASPEVRAAQAQVLAARARATGAAVLPDPTIRVEGTRMRQERANGLAVWAEQELPRWGERDAERGMASAEVAMALATLDDVRGMVAAEVAMALSQATSARSRAVLLDDEAERMRVLADQVTAAVAADSGGASASDVLTLRTRIQSAELMAADLRRMALDADDEARARLGVDSVLPDLMVPSAGDLNHLSYAPIRMAQAQEREARARVDLARSRGYPMVGLGVGWEREDLGMVDDGVMGMVEVSIPLYREAYHAEANAARAAGEAARHQVESARLRAGNLLRRVQRAQDQAAQAARVASAVDIRVDAELDALRGQMSAGAAGMGGRDVLMRIFERLDARAAARTAAIAAQAEAEAMAAELWRFIPDPESTP